MVTREPIENQGGFRAAVSLLRHNRNFRRLYLASVISLGGDWFLLVAGFGSLFIVAGKRYSELHTLGSEAGTRRSLSGPIGGFREK